MARKKLHVLDGYSLFEIREADERFKLKAGDIVLGCPYQWDPEKISVAFRIKDGFIPNCNQYSDNVRPLNKDEAEKAIWGYGR